MIADGSLAKALAGDGTASVSGNGAAAAATEADDNAYSSDGADTDEADFHADARRRMKGSGPSTSHAPLSSATQPPQLPAHPPAVPAGRSRALPPSTARHSGRAKTVKGDGGVVGHSESPVIPAGMEYFGTDVDDLVDSLYGDGAAGRGRYFDDSDDDDDDGEAPGPWSTMDGDTDPDSWKPASTTSTAGTAAPPADADEPWRPMRVTNAGKSSSTAAPTISSSTFATTTTTATGGGGGGVGSGSSSGGNRHARPPNVPPPARFAGESGAGRVAERPDLAVCRTCCVFLARCCATLSYVHHAVVL